MRRRRGWPILGVVLLLAGCGRDNSTAPPTTLPAPVTTPTTASTEPVYSTPDPSVCPVDHTSGDTKAPAAVGGVEGGSSAGSEEISVTWLPSTATDVVCYRVERAPAPGGPFVPASIVRVEGTDVVAHPDAANRYDPTVTFDGERFALVEYGLAVPGGRAGCCSYYRVIAIDHAGNEGRPSAVTCAATLVAEQSDDHCPSPGTTGG